MSRIETNIEEIEQYLDNCKYSPLSNTKIVVNRDELLELIDNLKRNIPDEIKKYQRIISNRDAILRDAQDKAEEMIKKANEMTSQLVSEHEVMQQAYKEANIVIENATVEAGRILDEATAQANAVKEAAVSYTDDSLATIQNILNNALEEVTVNYDGIKRALDSSLEVTIENRKALASQNQDITAAQPAGEQQVQETDDYYSGPAAGNYVDSSQMSVDEAEGLGQVELDYNDIRGGSSSGKDDLDLDLNISDFD